MSKENLHSTSLNKYISETGICSRREADKMIKAGRVKINGVVAISGNRVVEGDKVTIDDKAIKQKEKTVYLAFHKPVGITSTTDKKDKSNIIDYINYPKRIFPVGRLDKPSEGLLFLTNDGDIVNKILRAGNHHEKEYIVTVDKPITPEFIEKMGNGIPILGTVTKKCYVAKKSTFVFKIVLVQGLNRQIRRMCEYLGYNVVRLKRTRIMNIRLEGIAPGKWRYFSAKEIKTLNRLISDSSKTEEAS
ncbi:MAG: 23S rRNA pseudouridine(2604) synthase RluF [Bacteroidetes bacterium]|nr:MAG: 23S rRNA pseudouridine(2604) synthase RluF [Bacteroidota bacterium]